jgi:hypothetical protein
MNNDEGSKIVAISEYALRVYGYNASVNAFTVIYDTWLYLKKFGFTSVLISFKNYVILASTKSTKTGALILFDFKTRRLGWAIFARKDRLYLKYLFRKDVSYFIKTRNIRILCICGKYAVLRIADPNFVFLFNIKDANNSDSINPIMLFTNCARLPEGNSGSINFLKNNFLLVVSKEGSFIRLSLYRITGTSKKFRRISIWVKIQNISGRTYKANIGHPESDLRIILDGYEVLLGNDLSPLTCSKNERMLTMGRDPTSSSLTKFLVRAKFIEDPLSDIGMDRTGSIYHILIGVTAEYVNVYVRKSSGA